MLNLQVTVETIYFVLGDVHPMEQLDVAEAREAPWVIMTYVAALLGDVAVALDDIVMTEYAFHAQALHVSVIKGESCCCDELFRDFVTQRAARGALVESRLFEMTQEARALRDRDVLSLNDLGVTAGAT